MNEAASPPSHHQQLAVERHLVWHRRQNIGKSQTDVVAGTRIEPSLAAAGDELNADTVPFPLGQIIGRVEAREIIVFERLSQHQRREGRQIADVRRRLTALEPIEQRLIGRRQPVPDLLDMIDRDAAPFGERGLGEPRRDADPQAAGDELQQCPAPGRVERVEPRFEQARNLGAIGAL